MIAAGSAKNDALLVDTNKCMKIISDRLHYAKDTCKSLQAFFNNLASLEENYSNGLKNLLSSSTLQTSLRKCREVEMSFVKVLLDSLVGGMLQLSENHKKYIDFLKLTTTKTISDLLTSMREVKKKSLAELERDIKKDLTTIFDRIKTERSNLASLEKKHNGFIKRGEKTAEAMQVAAKINDTESLIGALEASIAQFTIKSKKKLGDALEGLEAAEIFRTNNLKNVFILHCKSAAEVYESDRHVMAKLYEQLEKINFELDLTDVRRFRQEALGFSPEEAKNLFQNLAVQKSISEPPKIESLKADLSPLQLQQSKSISPTKPGAGSATCLNISKTSTFTSMTSDQDEPSPRRTKTQVVGYPKPRVDNASRGRSDQSSGVSIYEKPDSEYHPKFQYHPSIFFEAAPHHTDIAANYDVKYLNIVIYMLVRNYMVIHDATMPTKSDEDESVNFLPVLKNRLKVLMKEQRLVDILFKLPIESKSSNVIESFKKQSKPILTLIIESLKGNLEKAVGGASEGALKTEEDYKICAKMFRHFVMLVAITRLWQLENAKIMGKQVTKPAEDAFLAEYEHVCTFFLETNLEKLTGAEFLKEAQKILSCRMLQGDTIAFGYPVSNQICETLFVALINTDGEGLFIEDWDLFYEYIFKFCRECLYLPQETIFLIALRYLFDRHLKIYFFRKDRQRAEECCQETYKIVRNLRKLMASSSDIRPALVNYINYSLTKEIWIGGLKLVESFKKSIPNSGIVIRTFLEILYIAFHYQQANLKIKDFTHHFVNAFSLSGYYSYKQIEIPFKASRNRSKSPGGGANYDNSPQLEPENFGVVLNKIYKEAEDTLSNLCEVLITDLSEILDIKRATFEKQLRLGYLKAIMKDPIGEIRYFMQIENRDGVTEDVFVIANELWKIDSIAVKYELENSPYYEVTSVSLEKWLIQIGKNMKEFLEKIKKEEKWVPNKDQEILHSNGPLDYCYILFNSVSCLNEAFCEEFKTAFLKRFEHIVYEAMNDYLESLVVSVSFMMNSKGPEFSQLLLTNMTKPRGTVNLKKELIEQINDEKKVESIYNFLVGVALRFGNIQFLERQLQGSLHDLFGDQPQIISSVPDFVATCLSRISSIFGKYLVSEYFRIYFFELLYHNFDEAVFSNSRPENFQEKYDYSAKELLPNLTFFMKTLKKRIPQQYFVSLMLEILGFFLNEYCVHIIDSKKAPRGAHLAYQEFLKLELKAIVDFFFPKSVINQVDKQKLAIKLEKVQLIIDRFGMQSSQLTAEFKSLNRNGSQKDAFLFMVIPRILLLRPLDEHASSFLKHYKKIID